MGNREETYTVPFESVRQPPKIEISQEPFYLTEVDFLHLTNGKPKSIQIALAIFLTSTGYLLVLAAKLSATNIFSRPTNIEVWEWVIVVIGVLASVVIYGISFCFPNEESRMKKEIKSHFQKSPRERQLPRAGR